MAPSLDAIKRRRYFARVLRHTGVWLLLLALGLTARGARADAMDLVLSRLSRGACARTLSDADDFALSVAGDPVLEPDRDAYAQLASQIGFAVAPALLAPVTTRGPSGFDIAFDTQISGIDASAEYWQRATRGDAPVTCDGRNGDVRSTLTSNRLRFVKGLPLGLSIGGNVGYVHGLGLWSLGTELKIGILEGATEPWLPSLGVRAASNTLIGDTALSLSAFTLDVLASREIPVAHVMTVVPYLAIGAVLTRVSTGAVDLTPNVDAHACAAGSDPVCNAQGLGASREDYAHNRTFPKLLLIRYRAVLGVWLRYRIFAFAAEASVDLVRPDRADSDVPSKTARQWSVQLAPSLSF